MFKWIIKLGDWLSEHAFIWPWDRGYQSATHLIWVWITFFGMLIMGWTLSDVTLGFTILIGGGQIFAVIQEFARWLIVKYTKNRNENFNPGNIFANIIGIVVGGLFACAIWGLFML